MHRPLKAYFGVLFLLLVSSANLFANHVMGGEITYQYLGKNGAAGTPYQYRLTLNIYIDRNSSNFPTGVEPWITFGIYDAGTHARIQSLPVQSDPHNINPVLPSNCNVPSLQHVRATLNTYQLDVELPYSAAGYYVIYERCCRNQVLNVQDNADMGNTFYAFIASPDYQNSSPVFAEVALPFLCSRDTTVIANNATDPDGDRLEYLFRVPYTGGTSDDPAPAPPATYDFPPDNTTYPAGYSLSQPFGPKSLATMDAKTGIARYAAPSLGIFAIAVEVREYRKTANNQEVLVGIVRRELQFVVGDCQPNEAPQFSAASTSAIEYTIRAGENLCLTVDATDTQNDITVSASGDILDGTNQYTGPKASFITTPSQHGSSSKLCWQTSCQVPAGSYKVTVKAQDDGCPPKTNTIIYTIKVTAAAALPRPTITAAGATGLCKGSSVTLSTPAQNGVTYQWKRDGINVGTNASSLPVTQSGTYSLALKNDCQTVESTNTVPVTIAEGPGPLNIVANGPVALCPGAATELTLVSPLSVPGLTYQWQKDQANLPGATQPVLTVSQEGSYRLMVSNSCGATTSNAIAIRKTAASTVGPAAQGARRCDQGALTLTASGGTDGNYRWYESAAATTAIPGQTNASFTTPVLTQTLTYYVSHLTDGCESLRTAVTATILEAPVASAGADVSIQLGERVTLTASGGNDYLWSPALGLNHTNVAAPVASPTQTTTYQVQVTSSEGCTATDEVTVEVLRSLVIPNAFSPNNDGVNDTWEIANAASYPNCQVQVFNRWGNIIYESTGYAVPWNGQSKGNDMPSATYFYRIDLGGSVPPVTGSVSIFK